jgi:Ca2+-binding RTX toxin-like protein
VTLSGYTYAQTAYRLEKIEFSDGTFLNIGTYNVTQKGTEGADVLAGINGTGGNDVIYGYGGDDSISGSDGHDTLRAGNGNDYVSGDSGNDKMFGEAGNDTLFGYRGNDLLDGGAGNDSLNGGNDNDTYVIKAGYGLDTVYDDGGVDNVLVSGGKTINDISVLASGASDLKLILTAGVDELTLSNHFYSGGYAAIETLRFDDGFSVSLSGYAGWRWGTDAAQTMNSGSGADTLIAKGGNDVVNGGAGNDLIHGGNSDDALYGQNDLDTIFGGTGNDLLSGGAGADKLYGGAGSDTFLFERATAFGASDQVFDFKTAEGDRLNIADLLDLHNPATDPLAGFVQITDNGTDSFLSIDRDGGGNGFVQVAQLFGVTNLTAGLIPISVINNG